MFEDNNGSWIKGTEIRVEQFIWSGKMMRLRERVVNVIELHLLMLLFIA